MPGAVLGTAAALVLFFVLDGALFHLGFYNRYVEPDSSAGEVEGHVHWLEESRAFKHEVLVMGDSRIAEGFSAREATAAAGGHFHYINFGIPGTAPRVWSYLLRDADPERNSFDAIVIQLPQYSDEDSRFVQQDRLVDLGYLAGRLRYSDCIEFAASFLNRGAGRAAFNGCILRGVAFRADLNELLKAPLDRTRRARDWMANGGDYLGSYEGKPETVEGLSGDFATRTLTIPEDLKPWQKSSIRSMVFPTPEPQTGLLTKYREQWLGRIIDAYRYTRTRIVFTETPRAPLPIPEASTPPRFLRKAVTQPNVIALPADTFRDLERPLMFADGLHLNKVGRPIYSRRLSERVAELLRPR